MTIEYLVAHLRAQRVELWLEDEQLRYRAPKSALSHDVLATLKGRKSSLIKYIQTFGPIRIGGDRIPEVEPAEDYRISADQAPLWFLDQLRGGNPSDHLCRAFRFNGSLNTEKLEGAFQQLIGRHESLRTVFRESRDGADGTGQDATNGVRQTILPTMPWRLEQVDLSTTSLERAIVEAKRICGEKTRLPLDLSKGPLLRGTFIRLNDNDYVLLIVMHHIIGDGHSLAVLTEELGEIYTAVSEDRSTWLPLPTRQYKDFSAHRRQQLDLNVMKADADYWCDRLKNHSQIVEFPLDHPRPAIQTSTGARAFFTIPKDACRDIRQFGQREGATLFMTVLAAFFVVMKRHTGQSDLLVGAPVSLRDRAEFETMIGMCLNTSVFALDAPDDLSFRDLLKRVRQTITDAFSHQRIPFQQLVNAVKPIRDLSRNQIFQVMFQVSPFWLTNAE